MPTEISRDGLFSDPKAFLSHLDSREKHTSDVAGLPFIGMVDAREAYLFPFQLSLNERCLAALSDLAIRFEAKLELNHNPQIVKEDISTGRLNTLLELCCWQGISFLLLTPECSFKTLLVQTSLELLLGSTLELEPK